MLNESSECLHESSECLHESSECLNGCSLLPTRDGETEDGDEGTGGLEGWRAAWRRNYQCLSEVTLT